MYLQCTSFLPPPFFVRRFRKIVKSDYGLRPFCPSVRMERLGSHLTDFQDILYFENFPKNLSRKFAFHENFTRITDALHEDQHNL